MMPRTKSCAICGSTVSLSNYGIHYGSKKCLSGGKQVANPSVECKYCKRSFRTSVGRGIHEIQCLQNPQSRNIQKGRNAWNKGNKSKPDLRNPQYIGRIGGYRANAGRSKKFKVHDSLGNLTTLQSTYEYAVFEILCELGIRWIRPGALKYHGRNYFADFYLLDFDIWLDPKNTYKAKIDQSKIDQVIKENNCTLIVLLENQINKSFISRVI